jgi:hypothetical protein
MQQQQSLPLQHKREASRGSHAIAALGGGNLSSLGGAGWMGREFLSASDFLSVVDDLRLQVTGKILIDSTKIDANTMLARMPTNARKSPTIASPGKNECKHAHGCRLTQNARAAFRAHTSLAALCSDPHV